MMLQLSFHVLVSYIITHPNIYYVKKMSVGQMNTWTKVQVSKQMDNYEKRETLQQADGTI